MRGWLLDTNIIAEVGGARPDARVAAWIAGQPEHLLYISILTIAEYQKGTHNLPPGDKRWPSLQSSVAALGLRFSGRVLPISDEIALRWGAISGEVKRRTGHSPEVIDTMLAATALEHGLYLVTRNIAHVAHSGAVVFNPWKDDAGLFPV